MINRQKVRLFRKKGLTFEEIGSAFGVSRQRIHQIFSGYTKRYQKTEKWMMYRRHYYKHARPYKYCIYCEAENKNFVNILDKSA